MAVTILLAILYWNELEKSGIWKKGWKKEWLLIAPMWGWGGPS